MGEVHRLVEKSKDVFDVRKIRSDQAYAIVTTRDNLPEGPRPILCMRINPITISLLIAEIAGDIGEKSIEWRRNELHGVVESSLWLAMSKYNADPQL